MFEGLIYFLVHGAPDQFNQASKEVCRRHVGINPLKTAVVWSCITFFPLACNLPQQFHELAYHRYIIFSSFKLYSFLPDNTMDMNNITTAQVFIVYTAADINDLKLLKWTECLFW